MDINWAFWRLIKHFGSLLKSDFLMFFYYIMEWQILVPITDGYLEKKIQSFNKNIDIFSKFTFFSFLPIYLNLANYINISSYYRLPVYHNINLNIDYITKSLKFIVLFFLNKLSKEAKKSNVSSKSALLLTLLVSFYSKLQAIWRFKRVLSWYKMLSVYVKCHKF